MVLEPAGVIESVQASLDGIEWDAVILASPPNIQYVSGAEAPASTLLNDLPCFVVVPRSGESVVVVCDFDQGAMKANSWIADVRPYTGNLAVPVLVEAINEKGLATRSLGLEEGALRVSNFRELAALLPSTCFHACDTLMQKLRSVKSPQEVGILRHAARCTEKAFYATFLTSRPGVTERGMADRITSYLRGFGATVPYVPLLTSGVRSTTLHLLPSDKPIVPGEVIHLDADGVFFGYYSDISRNAVMGHASPAQLSVYQRLWDIQQKIIERMTVGTRACDLYRLYVDLSAKCGFPHPMSTLGHGIGLEEHELPELDLNHHDRLEAGMVLAVEPTTIVAGDARYDVEDMVLVTERGPEVLSNFRSTKEMFVIA